METAVVILNWNTKGYLEKFLPSLLASCKGKAEVIVADNASKDGSLEMLKQNFSNIKTIAFDNNLGFTGGYNETFKVLKDREFKYYVLLNSDIEVPNNWIMPLISHMDTHPECGACAPKLHSYYDKERFEYAGAAGGYIDKYGYPFCRGRVLNKIEEDKGQYDTEKDVFWATGACLMVRKSAWEEVGGLDNRFFAHMEEIDLCWRLQLSGYKITIIPQSTVYHIGGGTLPNTSPRKLELNFRNNHIMLKKNLVQTYVLNFIQKGYSQDSAINKSKKKAKLTLFFRLIMDGLSSFIYLFTGKLQYVKAVYKAHSQQRHMQQLPTKEEIREYLKNHNNLKIQGIYNKWIIPEAIIKGNKIFETVRNIS